MQDLEQDFSGREVCWNGKRKEENYVRKNQRNYSRIIRSRRRNNYRGEHPLKKIWEQILWICFEM